MVERREEPYSPPTFSQLKGELEKGRATPIFDELFTSMMPRLAGIARKMGSREPEEMAQGALMGMIEQLQREGSRLDDEKGNAVGYLITSVRNRVIDSHRKGREILTDDPYALSHTEKAGQDVADQAIANVEGGVRGVVARAGLVDPKHALTRDVLLARAAGFSMGELAVRHNKKTRDAAKQALYRARKKALEGGLTREDF
jgi:DNA-directed RNA polymerase specialized sigma24 family protein